MSGGPEPHLRIELSVGLLCALTWIASAEAAASNSLEPLGPLKVHSANPRYFTDPAGHAVYLAGSHTWNDLVDMGASYPPRPFDFDAYLDFLQTQNHNLVRLWAWEVPWRDDAIQDPHMRAAAPQPWLRTGPGTDFGGQPKFDLTRFDPKYFQRLRHRVHAAADRGIYVIVMLFEAHVVQIVPTGNSHPFHAQNNINATDYLENVEDVFTLRHPELTRLQERYVREVVDAVNEFDNVLYEIADEGGSYSTEWQRSMLEYLSSYEAGKAKQHPIGLTFQIKGKNATLYESEADWISPGAESEHYSTAPLPTSENKVVIADTDHLGGARFADPPWVWRSFFRGLNLLYMDNYVGADSVGLEPTKEAVEIRAGIGLARLLAQHVDIGAFLPNRDLASTGYALRSPHALMVYAPDGSPFTVDLRSDAREFLTEWFSIQSGSVTAGPTVHGGKSVAFAAPESDGSILYFRSAADSLPPLAAIQDGAREIWRNAVRLSPWTIQMRFAALPILRPLAQSNTRLTLALCMSLLIGTAAGILATMSFLRRRRTSSPSNN